MEKNVCGKQYLYKKHEVNISGTLAKAMNFYARHKLSYTKLFYDHCDGWYTAEYLERNPFSPFETFYDAKGLQIYPDISIDETAFNNFVWETRKIVPSKMIEALFYSGSKNESAYECGFITDMINNGLKDSVLINPRPFLVREENCRKNIS